MVPAVVVGVPLAAVFFVGVVGVATLTQAMEDFDAKEREREAKPRKDGPFIEYWANGKKSAVGTYKNKKLDGVKRKKLDFLINHDENFSYSGF